MWPEHILKITYGQLAWYSKGSGKPLVFLHGGPGDEHRSLLPLAEQFTTHFHCIVYDQRGSGDSRLARLDESTLHPDHFVDDLEQLRLQLETACLNLVGHSWGAMLALLYGAAYPGNVERLALIGLGPLSDEMDRVAKANLMKPLSPQERQEYTRLSQDRHSAILAGDADTVTAINRQRMKLGFRGMFYQQELIDSFIETWLQYEPYRNWRVNSIVTRLLDSQALWARLPQLYAPTLVLYGYQDFEPITQAFWLKEQMPNVELCFINECGHVPWLEQPDRVIQALMRFLDAGS